MVEEVDGGRTLVTGAAKPVCSMSTPWSMLGEEDVESPLMSGCRSKKEEVGVAWLPKSSFVNVVVS